MAKAKKCDRCGQYYDKNEIGIPDALIGRMNQSASSTPSKIIVKTDSGSAGVVADMCDTCFEELFDWIGYPPEENPPVEPSEPEEGTDEIKPPANPEDNGSDQ